mmetsp:Transcript_65543/g.156683  ORF Transcript_65543/g.156683 Transcript_65543/m.156683 type:complete len:229 (+) Transcript_65543:1364-2050(+)
MPAGSTASTRAPLAFSSSSTPRTMVAWLLSRWPSWMTGTSSRRRRCRNQWSRVPRKRSPSSKWLGKCPSSGSSERHKAWCRPSGSAGTRCPAASAPRAGARAPGCRRPGAAGARLEGPAGTLPCEVLRAAATTRSCPRSRARDTYPDTSYLPRCRVNDQRRVLGSAWSRSPSLPRRTLRAPSSSPRSSPRRRAWRYSWRHCSISPSGPSTFRCSFRLPSISDGRAMTF